MVASQKQTGHVIQPEIGFVSARPIFSATAQNFTAEEHQHYFYLD